MINKRIGILTFQKFHGRKNIGSSRIRGEWLAKNWEGAEIFKQGQQYDIVIYQKAYWVEHAKVFKGIKILDLCDPDFLHWTYRTKEMLEEVDAVTTSTEALAEALRRFTNKPVICIPDRIDMQSHKGKKFHQQEAKWVVWYGYSTGFEMLKPVLHFLKKYNLNLIVIADRAFSLPVSFTEHIELKNFPWNIDTINQDILEGDFVINPKSKKGKWKYKSNNKTLSAWALGMPVAHDIDELKKFIDSEERKKEAEKRYQEIKDEWDIKYSVQDYKKLIQDIYDGRK